MEGQTQVNMAFWMRYPTPRFKKEDTCRIFHGKIYPSDFNMEYTSMSSIDNRIRKDGYYNNRLIMLNERI